MLIAFYKIGLSEGFNECLKDFTCFITGWISVFEQISWMNDSMTHSLTSLASLLDESLFFLWISWMNDSMTHSLTSPASLLDESVFLNKSLEWMIQWLTHWLHLLNYWMNQCFWTNLLEEWFNDSLIDFTCFITGWISVFEQISWMNDSMTHSLTSPASLLDESVFLNKSLEWMIQWLTHWLHLLNYWMNQCFWTNLLEEWFNDSLTDFTCFITGWISVFEQIS